MWKFKEWKNLFQVNGKQKGAGEAILMSDNTDFDMKCLKMFEK